jgi:hypothetical protein
MTIEITENITKCITRDLINSLAPFIRATDTDNDTGLVNFCYVNNPEINGEYQKNKATINACRGIVFDKSTMIMNAFSHVPDYSADDVTVLDEFKRLAGHTSIGDDIDIINNGVSKCRFFEAHEGVLIRMFCYNGKWFVTTHRKLNAFTSKWGGNESHGTSFKNALREQLGKSGNPLDLLKEKLDKSNQYMFLVRNTKDNRIVCSAPEKPMVYHVGTFIDGVLRLDDDTVPITKPREITITDIDDMYNNVSGSDVATSPGLIAFAPGNSQFRITNAEYTRLFNIRGNQSSIKFRYLQLRSNPSDRDMLAQLYPEFIPEFEKYEDALIQVTINIHTAYMDRFVNKKHVVVPHAEYNIIKTAHSWFHQDRTNRVVTKHVIWDILAEQSPPSLNQMIKRILYPPRRVEKKTQMDTQTPIDTQTPMDPMDIQTPMDRMDIQTPMDEELPRPR